MIITITQEDLDKANALRHKAPLSRNCLFAQILQRMGFPQGHVGASFLWPQDGFSGEHIPIPKDVRQVISHWEDTGEAPVGATFDIPALDNVRAS